MSEVMFKRRIVPIQIPLCDLSAEQAEQLLDDPCLTLEEEENIVDRIAVA